MAVLVSWSHTFLFIYVLLSSDIGNGDAGNILRPNQVLEKGQILTSTNGRFQLGFFNPSPNAKRAVCYLGIWYRGIEPLTVVWVANRRKSLSGIRIKLELDSVGNLFLKEDDKKTIFLVRTSNKTVVRPLLMLHDSGNLVIHDADNLSDHNYIWQSFDYPSDTLLPGMKLGWNIKSRPRNRVLISWRMSEDPSIGDLVFGIQSPESPQLLLKRNSVTQSRWGPWDGKRFSGWNVMDDNPVFKINYHSSPHEVYFMFELLDPSILLRLVVNTGGVQFLKWKNSSGAWFPMMTLNSDKCDRYMSCGPYGVCHDDERGCKCLKNFVPSSPRDWHRLDTTDGCRRRNPLNCNNNTSDDDFLLYTDIKLPDQFTVLPDLQPQECKAHCLEQCSCMAYTYIDIRGNGTECVVWLDKLIDLSSHGGSRLYVRLSGVDIIDEANDEESNKVTALVTGLLLAVLWALAFWGLIYCLVSLLRKSKKKDALENRKLMEGRDDDMDVQLFDRSTITAATNNFSPTNKIGEGGFGPVYQGQLPDGKKIAVKRLSEHSNQGLMEFKNETKFIAQLQHRNLVKLIGCCSEGEERMLVYEYMPNKSLDEFIFDPARKSLLPWEQRFYILKGIAKGLEYLHSGSRLRVIHRDLKASNILLDDNMNPKISDFGLARKCENEIQESTTMRVIGTHGYMSPEYLVNGQYSTKSDVFSYGVLALETISGERNWGYHHPDHDYNLLGHAWKLWVDGRELELKDPALEGSSSVETKISRCIQVGLLCVQQNTGERPTMGQVVSMLETESMSLSQPQEPGFFGIRFGGESGCSTMNCNYNSNGLTITTLSGRG